jgi:hypothetical protein
MLRSTCRNCNAPVAYTRLKELPEGHPKKSRWYGGTIWLHPGREPGEETYCDPDEKDRIMRKRAEPKGYCTTVPQGQYSSSICNRPVKNTDLFLCGIHDAARRKAADRDAKFRQERELSDYVWSSTLALQNELKERFGIDSKMHYDPQNHCWTGMILVNPAELVDFFRELFD